jgi:hypothetical protein
LNGAQPTLVRGFSTNSLAFMVKIINLTLLCKDPIMYGRNRFCSLVFYEIFSKYPKKSQNFLKCQNFQKKAKIFKKNQNFQKKSMAFVVSTASEAFATASAYLTSLVCIIVFKKTRPKSSHRGNKNRT